MKWRPFIIKKIIIIHFRTIKKLIKVIQIDKTKVSASKISP